MMYKCVSNKPAQRGMAVVGRVLELLKIPEYSTKADCIKKLVFSYSLCEVIMFRKLLKALLWVARKCREIIVKVEEFLEACVKETPVEKIRSNEGQVSPIAKAVKRVVNSLSYAADALGIANLCGAEIPESAPAIGAKVCSFISAKMSAALSICSSPLALWVLGLALAFVAGEILTLAVG
jgi:hypothetical protein